MKTPVKLALAGSALLLSLVALAQPGPGSVRGPGAGPVAGAPGPGMRMLDTDGDGTISKAEVDAHFVLLDTNRDGKISADEIQARRDAMRTAMREQMFKSADKDGDGKLSQDEAQAMRPMARGRDMQGKHQGRPASMGGRSGSVCRADANGDGIVTRSEAEQSGTRLLQRFDTADTNKDGKLDATELQAQCRRAL